MPCVKALKSQYKIIKVGTMCLQACNKVQSVAILGVFTTTLCSCKPSILNSTYFGEVDE